MGEDGDIFFSEWDRNYRYRTSYGDYVVPASTFFSDIFEDLYTERTKENGLYEIRYKKLDEILYDVLLDFAGSGIKLIRPDSPHIFVGCSKSVVENIIIEGSNKKTTLTYDPETHEISGFVWMSLGDRDLTEATEEEVGIIRRALLIWIYENI